MKIKHISIPTKVAYSGMTVGEVIRECVEKDVPGIPFADADGNLTSRFSLRHMFLLCCIPSDILQGAHLLGDDIDDLDFPNIKADELMAEKVDKYIFPDIIRLSPNFQAIKALAIMERNNTNYLFVSEDGVYQGVVTRQSIAKAIITRKWCEP